MTEEMKSEILEEEAVDAAEAQEETAEETEATEEAAEEKAEEAVAEGPTEEEKESERYMRLMAEFQNFKKRSAKEKSDIHAYANEKIALDLLPVLDNFERALSADPANDPEAYAKGMALIFDQVKAALEKAGLAEVEALGEDFDPNKHAAVMTEATEEYESGKVSKVLQKGYSLNKKVIRPSMVAVAE